MAAIANTGGGVIVIGLENDGAPSGQSPKDFLQTDLATIVDAWSKYLGEQFDDFEIHEAKKARKPVAILVVRPRTGAPLVFDKPGTYNDGHGKQKTAFSVWYRLLSARREERSGRLAILLGL